jgi:hypothetical protein
MKCSIFKRRDLLTPIVVNCFLFLLLVTNLAHATGTVTPPPAPQQWDNCAGLTPVQKSSLLPIVSASGVVSRMTMELNGQTVPSPIVGDMVHFNGSPISTNSKSRAILYEKPNGETVCGFMSYTTTVTVVGYYPLGGQPAVGEKCRASVGHSPDSPSRVSCFRMIDRWNLYHAKLVVTGMFTEGDPAAPQSILPDGTVVGLFTFSVSDEVSFASYFYLTEDIPSGDIELMDVTPSGPLA